MQTGIIGGTGHEGRGIAARLAAAGVPVLVGSRQIERARETVAALGSALPLEASTNDRIAAECDVVFFAVPFDGVADITEQGADAHINKMAKKYLGQDTYPYRQPGEVRVLYKIRPEQVQAYGS